MPAYVDTSALVKRYVAEVGSAWVRRLLAHPAQYVIYTSALSQVEVISALQRRVREGTLAEAQAQRLAHRVTVHFEQSPQSTRRNTLPVKRIDGSLLMGHKYLACALV